MKTLILILLPLSLLAQKTLAPDTNYGERGAVFPVSYYTLMEGDDTIAPAREYNAFFVFYDNHFVEYQCAGGGVSDTVVYEILKGKRRATSEGDSMMVFLILKAGYQQMTEDAKIEASSLLLVYMTTIAIYKSDIWQCYELNEDFVKWLYED